MILHSVDALKPLNNVQEAAQTTLSWVQQFLFFLVYSINTLASSVIP